jgi:hypothetical protein
MINIKNKAILGLVVLVMTLKSLASQPAQTAARTKRMRKNSAVLPPRDAETSVRGAMIAACRPAYAQLLMAYTGEYSHV